MLDIGESRLELLEPTRDDSPIGKFLSKRGEGLHHVIDPRTGWPAATGLAEVSVVTRTAVDAEIVAKAALIAGPDLAPAFCAAHAEAWWLRPS